MASQYGLQCFAPNGTTQVMSPSFKGGTFIEVKYAPSGVSQTTYYQNVPGNNLRVFQGVAGDAIWGTGVNAANNQAFLQTDYSGTDSTGVATTLLVFAKQTLESDFGVNMLNDDGERNLSSLYPQPEFISLIGYGAGYTTLGTFNGYTGYRFDSTTTLGAGRDRIILWNMPNVGANDIWFNARSFIPSSETGTSTVSVTYWAPTGTVCPPPQGLIFALNGHQPSADTWGIRVWDASGTRITYDSGLNTLNLAALDLISYPGVGTTNTYNPSSFPGIQPALFIPSYARHVYAVQPNGSYLGKFYDGLVRRSGNTLQTKLQQTGASGASPTGGDLAYGNGLNLPVGICNAFVYGGQSM